MDVADVVERDVLLQFDLAGVAVHFDDRDVGSEGPGEVLRVEYADGLESRFGSFREAFVPIGREGDLLEGLGVGGRALHEVLSVLVDYVFGGGFEQVGGNSPCLVLDLPDAHVDGVAAADCAPRAEGACSHLDLVGVALDYLDVFDGYAKFGRGKLRECGVVSLSVSR